MLIRMTNNGLLNIVLNIVLIIEFFDVQLDDTHQFDINLKKKILLLIISK